MIKRSVYSIHLCHHRGPMTKARKRQHSKNDQLYTGCLVSKSATECTHCSYVLHELLNHEKRWLSITKRIMKNEQNKINQPFCQI